MYDIRNLLILGCGYVGERFALEARDRGTRVTATTRSPGRAVALRSHGIDSIVAATPEELTEKELLRFDAVLDSIPLARDGADRHVPQLHWLPKIASGLSHIHWAGYLSTTGVYGDADGAWVDESYPCRPVSWRGTGRLQAEDAWLSCGLPAEVFRIAGIYGPGRNLIPRLKAGGYKVANWQPPRWSNRIHVDDIVKALCVAMAHPRPGRIVNLADDCPLPHATYVLELSHLVDAPTPIVIDPVQAELELSPAALDFFRDNKRISNALLHRELLPKLRFPSFREAVDTLG